MFGFQILYYTKRNSMETINKYNLIHFISYFNCFHYCLFTIGIKVYKQELKPSLAIGTKITSKQIKTRHKENIIEQLISQNRGKFDCLNVFL